MEHLPIQIHRWFFVYKINNLFLIGMKFNYPSSHKFGTQENWDFRDFGKNGFSKKLGLSGFLKNGLLKKIGTYELGLYKIDF